MRVLVLHSRYLSGSVSGENRVVDDETTLLRSAGHEVELWTPAPDTIGTAHAGARTVWSTDASRRVRAFMRAFRPDVVHVHNLFPMLSPSVLRVVPDDVGLLMTLHNYRYACLPGTFLRDGKVCEDCLGRVPWRGVVHACFRDSKAASAALATAYTVHKGVRSFERIDRFLSVSGFMRTKHIDAGIPAGKIVVQPNFTHAVQRREGPGDVFLYVGRLALEKGLRFLVEAWSGTGAKLLVVGDGPDAELLRAAAPPGVTFRDRVPGDEIPALLRSARALLVPSQWYEGSPRSIIEAYAAGVPVLASKIGSLPEVVNDGVTGRLLEPGDVSAWLGAIAELGSDERSRELGEGAHAAWAASYRPDDGLARLEENYAAALAHRAASVR